MIIGWTVVDLFGTVFMIAGGASTQTHWIASSLWRAAIAVQNSSSQRSHSLLRAAGPLIVLLAQTIWLLELMLGWALVFVPDASNESGEVDFSDRHVFSASSLVGRGGNTHPLSIVEGIWEVIHIVASATGATLVTVGLTCLLPVLSGVAQRRSVAAAVHMLGSDVDAMRRLAPTQGNGSFELHLISLVPAITTLAEINATNPVLHYIQSKDRHAALAPSLSILVDFLRDREDVNQKVNANVTEPL